MAKTVKIFISESVPMGSDNPLSFEDRIKYEMTLFCDHYPWFHFDILTDHEPFVVQLVNGDTGEIYSVIAKQYDGKSSISYTINGKSADTLSFDDVLFKN